MIRLPAKEALIRMCKAYPFYCKIDDGNDVEIYRNSKELKKDSSISITILNGFKVILEIRRLPYIAPRFKPIAKLIAEGKSDQEIAVELKKSHSTIRTYVRHLYKRLGISKRAELVNLAPYL